MGRKFLPFIRHTHGNVTIAFAIAVVPVLLAAGSAIDYMRYTDARTSVQAALDGAALAAALPENKTDAERVAIASEYFERNLSYRHPEGAPLQLEVKINPDTIVAKINAEMPTSFMRLGGVQRLKLKEIAEVMRPFAGTAEIALVLDYSLSMNTDNKAQEMSAAAIQMINELDAELDDDRLKVGLVPFSAMVYTSMDKAYVTQSSATATWTGCTQDRRHPYNTNVDTPGTSSSSKWGFIDTSSSSFGNQNKGSMSCSYYASKNLKIVPLTTNMSSLTSKLSVMKPLGYTNLTLGAEFGWNLLDPQLPFDQASAYNDAHTRKFIILLTDGDQTTPEFDNGSNRTKNQANDNLLTICQQMHDKKITVFTIAYSVPADADKDAVTARLKACAPGRYYEPEAGGGEINKVFQQIKSQITNRIARVAK